MDDVKLMGKFDKLTRMMRRYFMRQFSDMPLTGIQAHVLHYIMMESGRKDVFTKDLEEFLDITPGSMSVLGLMNDKENRVQLLIDEDVLRGKYIGCHPCINTSSLKIDMKDMMEKIIPAMEHEPIFVKLGQEE